MKSEILNYISETFGLEGDDAKEIFDSYVKTVVENFALFDECINAKDFFKLTRAAHSIKGCALNCGHNDMAEAAKAVEFAAKASDESSAKDHAKIVAKLTAQLKAEAAQ